MYHYVLRFAAVSLLLSAMMFSASGQDMARKSVFKRITLEHGLPAGKVSVITQTRDGVMWFGTGAGFCKYDNGAITVYAPESGSSFGNDVRAMYEDRSGTLWIGMFGGGMYRFDRVSGKLTQYKSGGLNTNTLSDDRVLSILEDRDGTMWIGTVNGLNTFDRTNLNFSHIKYDPEVPLSLSENRVWPLAEDRAGNLWIGTLGGGLNKLDKSTGSIRVFRRDGSISNTLAGNSVTALYSDKSGKLWIGLESAGLDEFIHEKDEFDRQREEFRHHLHGMNISSICEDTLGNIVVGTLGSGLKVVDKKTGVVTSFGNDPADQKTLGDNRVRCVFVDDEGILWIGTDTGGVNVVIQEEVKTTKRKRKIY
ncbi:MAG: two-component regulator propeller domain-containing protein [Bacteroidota bacterium]